MVEVRRVSSADELREMKRSYLEQATAILDGMWLHGFLPQSSHFAFHEEGACIGYCCVNDEGQLLQFFVAPSSEGRASELFDLVTSGASSPVGPTVGSFVSTAEPRYLSLCLDRYASFEVNALMYELADGAEVQDPSEGLAMDLVESSQLSEAVDFAKAATGAPVEWLEGYFTNLIERRELFGCWESGRLVATGESRGREDDVEHVDVGVVVAESERGRGLATGVLRRLIASSVADGRKPICSAEVSNVASRTAIGRAGFVARNRIVRFFDES
ncbi:MAG: GNAT family N-acetyltransferase [Acidobacteriota bacterium]